MISIRKYLEGYRAPEAQQTGDPGSPALRLLEALDQHVFSGTAPYAAQLRALLEEPPENGAADEAIERLSAEACAALAGHAEARRAAGEKQVSDLQKMVSMLTDTVAALSSGNERSVTRLRRIERELEQVSKAGDLAAIKTRLSDCLSYVREEAARERAESARFMTEMEERVKEAQNEAAAASAGISGRREAESALATRGGAVSVAMVLDNLPAVRARFGAPAAEDLSSEFTRDLLRQLPRPVRLFRWSPHAFVAVIDPEAGADAAGLRSRLGEVLQGIATERRVQAGSRSAVLTLAFRWTVVAAGENGGAARMARDIDQFIATARIPNA